MYDEFWNDLYVGNKYSKTLTYKGMRSVKIPLTKEHFYIFKFSLPNEDKELKFVSHSSRRKLKKAVEGDNLKATFVVKEKINGKKFIIDNLRINDYEVY